MNTNDNLNMDKSLDTSYLKKKTANGVTREELEAYLGESALKPYYQKALNNYMDNPKKANWNWPAAFVSMYWFCYRKSFIPAVLTFLLTFITISFIPGILGSLVSLFIMASIGLYGTNIFLRDAERVILNAKSKLSNLDTETFHQTLTKLGKKSFVYPVVFYLCEVILLTFLLV